MVNLFGKGFIGSYYADMFPCHINDRNDLIPKAENILYLISTVDNYNLQINPYIDIETNLITLIRVLENWRQRFPTGTFNFASSWFVYGDTELPAKETSLCNPKGFYSITKKAAEELLVSYCETYNLKYRILRFANVLGLGDSKVSKKKNAVTYMINQMKMNLPIDVHFGGKFIRDYIHVKDLCNAVNLVINSDQTNQIFNISNGIPIKFIDIVDHVVKLGSTSSINLIDQLQNINRSQIKDVWLDNEKIRNLGYVPNYTIENIVEELYFENK